MAVEIVLPPKVSEIFPCLYSCLEIAQTATSYAKYNKLYLQVKRAYPIPWYRILCPTGCNYRNFPSL